MKRSSMLSNLGLVALLVGAATGCDHRREDFDRTSAATQSFQDGWSGRVTELQGRHGTLRQRAQQIPPDFAGVTDVLNQLTTVETDLGSASTRLTVVTDDARARIAQRRRRLAEDALALGDHDLRTAVDAAAASLQAIDKQLTVVEKARADAIAAVPPPSPPDAIPVLAQRDLADPVFAYETSIAELPEIEFKPGTGQIDLTRPGTKPGLDKLLAFANTCDQLRFTITGHTAKDGDAATNGRISEARAQSISKYLQASKVPEARILKVEGVGGNVPLLEEPEPGSDLEKAMPTDKLAALRATNRRITITVVTPCPKPPPS